MNAAYVLELIQENKIGFIHLQFTDILGMNKSVAVPAATIGRVFSHGLRFDGSAVDAFVRSKKTDMYLHPDPSTFAFLPWSDANHSTARMLCTVKSPDGTPYKGCPRHLLQEICQEISLQGYDMRVSAELEFYLLARDAEGLPTTKTRDRVSYFDLAPASPGDETRRTVVLYLTAMGIPVEASHHEISPGQHGIDLGPGDPLTTADRILTAKAIVRRAAIQHGLHATFMPRPAESLGPSNLHLSLSMWKSGTNILPDASRPRELSTLARNLVNGVLSRARELALVGNPLVNSYKREAPDIAASEAGNGVIRIPPERGPQARIELRIGDCSSNPYLLLASTLRAASWGMRLGLTSHPKDSWPEDLGEAIHCFEDSSFMRECLGDTLYQNFLTAKAVEWRIFRGAIHHWELEQYLEKY